ncbi:hypothetical protein QUF58_04860 [Anaerolineales bacterium HSG24]|nr:hypothetical protein [Anaerolineales bacterium HSG24]
MQRNHTWPIVVQDQKGRYIYLTSERWDHALDHPGMDEGILEQLLETIRKGSRKQDRYDSAKFKYIYRFENLPLDYTHVVVVVKFGWQMESPQTDSNFVLTAYLVEKW